VSKVENYYEIYIQKKLGGKQMFCLKHTNQKLVPDPSDPL